MQARCGLCLVYLAGAAMGRWLGARRPLARRLGLALLPGRHAALAVHAGRLA
jgi:hypothetical protein